MNLKLHHCSVFVYSQTTQVMASYAELVAVVTIANASSLNEKCTTDKGHTLVLLIGDSDGKVVYKVRIR